MLFSFFHRCRAAAIALMLVAVSGVPVFASPFEDAVAQFANDSFSDTEAAVGVLATSGNPLAFPIIDALADGRLLADPQSKKVFVKDKGGKVLPVTDFREKPDLPTAERYLADKGYYWNSGMFIWKAATILKLLKTHLPASAEPLEKIHQAWGGPDQESALQEWFPQMPKISIDFAVMEKAKEVYGIPLDCRWLDLGSFAALADIISSDANHNIVVAGHSQLLDCRNTIVATEDAGHLIALIGVEDMIVAHSPDATLICPAGQSHRIKELLALLEKRGQGEFL